MYLKWRASWNGLVVIAMLKEVCDVREGEGDILCMVGMVAHFY